MGLNLKFDEFAVLPTLSKKKVLKNLMIFNRQASLSTLSMSLDENLEEYIIKTENNKEILDPSERAVLEDKL